MGTQGIAPAWWIVGGSVVTALAVATVSAPGSRAAIWLGMLAPLVVVVASWMVSERTYRSNPERLTGVMMKAFVGKLIFFGLYVAVVVGVLAVEPVPFVLSFAGYFIALHLIEAVLLKRLFVS